MNKRKKFLATIIGLLASAGVAYAEPSAARLLIQERSLEKGLNSKRVLVMKRKAGRGNDQVASELLARLGGILPITLSHQTETEDVRLSLRANEWTMKVSDDGNSARFRIHRIPAPVSLSEKPDVGTIETMGQAFIAKALAGHIALGPDDALVFLGSKYGYVGSANVDGTVSSPDQLAESIAIFGRVVHGEVVVGGGSTVAVIFNGDRSVQGFDFDWPGYEVDRADVEVLSVDAIRLRERVFQPTLQPNTGTSTEARFECGYFDPGGRRRRRPEFIQAACARAVVHKGGNTRSAAMSIVPASRQPTSDDRWTELSRVCEQRGACVGARGAATP